jgi:diguanylate cyclase
MGERNHLTDIEAYSKEVLTAMKIDHVPLIPANYNTYFEKNLESKDIETRKAILKLMDVEKSTSLDRVIDIEYKVKENFSYIKKILENVSGIYSNTKTMVKLLHDKQEELEESQNAVQVKNVIHALDTNISALKDNLYNQSKDIRELYAKSTKIVKYIDMNSIYDMKYELFNKDFFIEQVNNELSLIREFGHSSSLILLSVHSITLQQIEKQKTKDIIHRSVTKVFHRTIRKCDLIAHFGDNVFAILLKHSKRETAVKITEKLREYVKRENFFINSQEIDINIATSLLTISKDIENTSNIYELLENGLKEANEYGNENRIIFVK